jgi:hypothetical protein
MRPCPARFSFARFASCSLIAVLLGSFMGCAMPSGDTPAEERAYALQLRKDALDAYYAENPGMKERAEAAAGTYFLSGFAIHPGMLTFANGYAVIENNRTKDVKYARQVRFGVGPGISVKGHYLLVIVYDEAVLNELVDGSWGGGAFAEASFIFGDFGGSAVGEGLFSDKMEGHLWTHTGVGLELTVCVAHISGDDDLNDS